MKSQYFRFNLNFICMVLLGAGLITMLFLAGFHDSVRAEPAQSPPPPKPLTPMLTDQDLKKIDPELTKEINANGQADFFIWMTEKADLSPASQLSSKLEKGRFVFNTLRDTADRTQKEVIAFLESQGVEYRSYYIANNIFVHQGNQTLIYLVAARPDVARLTPNSHFQAIEPIISPVTSLNPTTVEPNISFIKADQVWDLDITGQGMVLAGNDTGLYATHPAIARHYRGCLNPPTCDQWDHNYNWWDATGAYPNSPGDNNGHGTMTTGIMIGYDGGVNQIGVAPGAQTIHCKNMDANGSGIIQWFEECFQWDLAPWDLNGQNPDPAKAPDAINNSWTWYEGIGNFRDEIDALQAAGILVEASAGNSGAGCSTLGDPADYAEVVTTGSTNHAFNYPGQLTGFSSRGPSLTDAGYFPDVLAPGENVRSSYPGGGYANGWGTSFSGPHVVGLVGLLWSANPLLRGQVEITSDIIKHTAVPLSGQIGSNCGGNYISGPNNDWGYGTINALAAVQLALKYQGSGTISGLVSDESANPLPGTTIWASSSPTITFQTTNDAVGEYNERVYSDTYQVSAMAYGFGMESVSDIGVISGTNTVQNFSLPKVAEHVISGTVHDSIAGYPLYAHITVLGDPVNPPAPMNDTWSNLHTGSYSLALAEGITYTLKVDSYLAGYLPTQITILPLSGDLSLDLSLVPDPGDCPVGYQFYINGLAEQFESKQLPPGWTVIDNAGTGAVWTFDDPGGRGNLTGGGGNFAIADSDHAGQKNMDTELRSPVLDFTNFTTVNLAFNYDFYYAFTEVADVDVSTHGSNGPWTNVWTRTMGNYRGPAQSVLDISTIAAGQPDVMIRFHYYNANWDWWWEVDKFLIGNFGCNPMLGGWVVGNVTDANTGFFLNDVNVTGDNGQETKTVPTPLDPSTGDGLYFLFSPPDTHIFTNTIPGYELVASQVDVIPNDTVRLDFSLPTGEVQASPETLAITLEQGLQGSIPLTLTNPGGWAATYNISEIDYGSVRKENKPLTNLPTSPGWYDGTPIPQPVSASASAQCADQPDSFYLIGGQYDWLYPVAYFWRYDVDTSHWASLTPLPQPVNFAAATCYKDKIYVAGGIDSMANTLHTLYIYNIAMDTWTLGQYMPRFTYAEALGAWNDHLYLVSGYDAWNYRVDVYDIQANQWHAGGGAPMPTPTYGSGWTQVDNYLYLIGGYTLAGPPGYESNLTQRYDMAANVWELGPSFPSKMSIFGLAATEKYLYAIGGDMPGGMYFDSTSLVQVLDFTAWPYGAWQDLNDPIPNAIDLQAGFCTPATDSGYIWSVEGTYGSVYATDFNWYRPSEPCYKTPSDVNWLSAEPVSGTLEEGQTSVIQLNIDTLTPGLTSGIYEARLRVGTNTPYGAGFIPISLTVIPSKHNFELMPVTPDNQTGHPGEVLTYTLQVSNTGELEDSYNVEISATWQTSAPLTVGPILPDTSGILVVQVTIPNDAVVGEQDVAVITVTSQANPSISHQLSLTTTAFWHRMFIPITMKN